MTTTNVTKNTSTQLIPPKFSELFFLVLYLLFYLIIYAKIAISLSFILSNFLVNIYRKSIVYSCWNIVSWNFCLLITYLHLPKVNQIFFFF